VQDPALLLAGDIVWLFAAAPISIFVYHISVNNACILLFHPKWEWDIIIVIVEMLMLQDMHVHAFLIHVKLLNLVHYSF
jgi:hypothetical protein